MKHRDTATVSTAPRVQRASLDLKIGERARLHAEVSMTSDGLLAIGGLVSLILLSTAVVVRTARR